MRWLFLIIASVALGGIFLWFQPTRNTHSSPLSFAEWVDYDTFPWLPAEPLHFPGDHGIHVSVPLETWLIQGVLSTPDHRTMGFQYQIFALTLEPQVTKRTSAWATQRIFMAYFTLTDATGFQVGHREEREALGLVETGVDHIHIDDWKLEFGSTDLRIFVGGREKYLQLELQAKADTIIAEAESAARIAYLLPRLVVTGSDGHGPVTGTAWMEHAWGRLPLPGGAVSLQRLQLQLTEGRYLSCLQIQRRDAGTPGPTRCMLTSPSGNQKRLVGTRLIPVSHWRQPGGKVYPVSWRLESPEMTLEIEAVIPDQVIPGPLSWWSGWVRSLDGSGKRGEGFMQATGVGR